MNLPIQSKIVEGKLSCSGIDTSRWDGTWGPRVHRAATLHGVVAVLETVPAGREANERHCEDQMSHGYNYSS